MSSRIILDADDFADILQTLEMPINKHAMHDQSSHGNWAGKGGGNNLSIKEVMELHLNTDSLKRQVYDAELALVGEKSPVGGPPQAPLPQNYSLDRRAEYNRDYKEYSKKWTEWAVEKRKNILTKDGEKILDGSPSGVKKYVEKVVTSDWFVEKFGDGSSLPPLKVNTANTNASGRHILKMSIKQGVAKSENIISINRVHTKDEFTILHEISHLATAQSVTKEFEGHGTEFANNLVYIVTKAVSPEFGNELRDSYIAKGVPLGN